MITIYQIHLSDEDILAVNARGWDAVPKASARASMQIGFGKFKEEHLKFYEATYEVDTDDLEEAFEATNLWGGYSVKRLTRGSSTSVGDIAVKDSNCYFCDTFGWVNIGKYEGFK
jgi:hypothetical protein